MSLENAIEKLTEAIIENTNGLVSAPAPAPKKAEKPKAEKPKAEKPKAGKPKEEVAQIDRAASVTRITEYVKEAIINPDGDSEKVKATFSALRESYGVAKVGDLPDDKLEEFYAATVEALS